MNAGLPFLIFIAALFAVGDATAATAPDGFRSPPGPTSNLTATTVSDFEVFLTWDRPDDTDRATVVERSSDGGKT